MVITDEHWEVFRLRVQDKKPYLEVAEEMGISYERVRQLQLELRQAEPELFPFETERLRFGQAFPRDDKKLLQTEDVPEDEIREKF